MKVKKQATIKKNSRIRTKRNNKLPVAVTHEVDGSNANVFNMWRQIREAAFD